MLDVVIVYDVEGWAYHSRALALARHAPSDIQVRLARYEIPPLPAPPAITAEGGPAVPAVVNDDHVIEAILGESPPDVVFLLCAFVAKRFRRVIDRHGWSTRVVASWNVGWPRRQPEFNKVFDFADTVVINNRDYWDRSGRPPRTVPISNGVELREFEVRNPIGQRKPRVLWCGSTHHQKLKGYEDYIVPLFEILKSEGIDSDALLVDSRGPDRRTRREMIDWYNSGTVLVCASESEGTPNPALEAAACGCTLVSTRVGNMPELIRSGHNGLLVDRDLDALLHGVRLAVFDSVRLANNLQQDLAHWDWGVRAGEYYELFRRLVAHPTQRRSSKKSTPTPTAIIPGLHSPPGKTPDARSSVDEARAADLGPIGTSGPQPAVGQPAPSLQRPDLSAELTVFVSTVGATSFSSCLEHLRGQDCAFRLEIITGVAPMSAAFQRMHDRCQTPYYIQVDEDMLLRPYAVRRLYERIAGSSQDVALVVEWLWDTHLARPIQGVKAYRHSVVREFPYHDVQSCEKDQLARLQQAGYRYLKPEAALPPEDSEAIVGLHGDRYDATTIFERYYTLQQKWLTQPQKLVWFASQPARFLERFCDDPTEENLMALMGVVAGRLVHEAAGGVLSEKDFRTYGSLPGLAEARRFFLACQAGVLVPAPLDEVLP